MDTRLDLITLVLNALHGLVSFYGRDYASINLDGLFGLRIIEGQLNRLYDGQHEDIPLEVMAEIKLLSSNASKLANIALPHVYDDNPDYFKKFKHLVQQPWDISNGHRLTDQRMLWPRNARNDEGCIDEGESDECVVELMEAASTTAVAEKPLGVSGCKRITERCLQRMMSRKGCSGYSLTHQLLYVTVAEKVKCGAVVDAYSKRIGYNDGITDFMTEFCSNLLNDLLSEKAVGTERVNPYNQDLFMESQFVCGELGFVDFIRREWLDAALLWQGPSGCYSNLITQTYNQPSERIPGRQLLLEKELGNDCASHKSAVAAGLLSVYLRFLIDPGAEQFHGWLLKDKPIEYSSLPLSGKFWKPSGPWIYVEPDVDSLVPLPHQPTIKDSTLVFFIPIALFFLYVTYRLCKRRNVRYMRWRGLKWR